MMHPLVYYISQSTTDENNKALAARPGISSMERCPSGLRCMIGNHVDGEYRHGGSNPPLSAKLMKVVKRSDFFPVFLFYRVRADSVDEGSIGKLGDSVSKSV